MPPETSASTSRYGACLLFAANALARAVTVIGDARFAQLGLSYSHAYLLNEVAQYPGQTPTALSETLFLSPSTITRLIEKLEGKGMVRRQPEGKRTLVFATETGQALAPAIAKAWQDNWATFAENLGEAEAVQLTKQIIAAAEKFSATE
ncbi:winged helix-turn-helix transcriptional regulator [Fibrella sp. HMF5036]|uniref:Winged helix-turn-helix transcriptional regulator n=2 Tax=Fibrella aquatilis TaxID=2817059 RepID=A0A939G3A7_9BACT|nr:winged helix-turn-helix transcriptional regulator [Fibrella aquatilis]